VETALRFRLRDAEGRVTVRYLVNEEPARWGFDRLGLDFDIEVARGFPVVEARVEYAAEGYAASLGWIQGVRYWVDRQPEPTLVIPDVAPQLRDAQVPYLSFGIQPTLFDAPAFTEQNVVWRAWSFLTQTPDLLMTPVVEPVCGFTWGYDIVEGRPAPTELRPASGSDWLDLREDLRAKLPGWTFGGDGWDAPGFRS
jgi:hypothetical protein